MEFYSDTKKNKILWFAGKWVELENITLNEINQVQKAECCMFSIICEYRLNTIQQYYEKQVMLRGGHIGEGGDKRRMLKS
jgi:hypothetical protein